MKPFSHLKYSILIVLFAQTALMAQVGELIRSGGSCVGSPQQFYLPEGNDCTNFVWTISGPHTTPSYDEGGIVYDFAWTQPGNYSVSCTFRRDGVTSSAQYPSTISIINIAVPEVTISRSPTTSPFPYGTPITFNASNVNGSGGSSPTYQWYVNSTYVGGGTQYTSSTLQNNNQVYVRMVSSAVCASPASDDSNVITVNVTYSVSPPTVAPITATYVYNGSITLAASGANTAGGEVYRWYDQSSGGTKVAEGITGSIVMTDNRTLYVSIYSPLGAESTRVPQTITIIAPPPDAPTLSINTCEAKTLTRGTPPANITWYWVGTNPIGQPIHSNATYTVTDATNQLFYLRAKINTANIWSTATGISVTTDPVDLILNSTQPLNSIIQASHSITLGPNFSVAGQFTAKVAITGECNDAYNWTEEIVYDQNGEPLSRSRSYTTGLGESLQSQTLDPASGKVWVTQPLYDSYNNASALTLPAPISESDFIFKKKFTLNSSLQPYTAADFDSPSTLNSPNPVDNTVSNTVGWYYSNNNTLEPNTPTTTYPYARSYTPPGPDPVTTKTAGAGDRYRMGSGNERTGDKQLLLGSELSHYISKRSQFVPNSGITYSGTIGYKYISTDPDEKMTVSFVDADGRTLASAVITNGSKTSPLYDYWSYNFYNDMGQLVASVSPLGINTGSPNAPLTFISTYKYDYLGRLIETTSPDEGTSKFVYSTDGKIRFSQNQEQYNNNQAPQRFSYTNYDKIGRLIESGEYTSNGTTPYVFQPYTEFPSDNSILNLIDDTGFVNLSAKVTAQASRCANYTFIEYDVQAADLPTDDADHAHQNNLFGQISKTQNANATTWYSYDEFGHLEWSKQSLPIGQSLQWTNVVKVTVNGDKLTDTNGLNNLWNAGAFSVQSIPANTDGWVEFTAGATNTYKMMGLSATDGGTPYTTINYALFPSNDGSLYVSENGTLRTGALATYSTIDILRVERLGTNIVYKKNGVVLYTSTSPSTSVLYVDCSFATLNTSIQNISIGNGSTNIKTVDYVHNYFGNVTQTIYQKNKTDKFYHFYSYDADQRLTKVYTSLNGIVDTTLQAKYYYYLHGPLKRMELASNLQGIDYTYTLQGALKSINHMDVDNDPGADGKSGAHSNFSKDVFGLTLSYFDNDFASAGHNAGNISPPGSPNNYDGTIKSVGWFSPVDYTPVKRAYNFTYDNLNQLQSAKWGTVTGTNGNYTTTLSDAYKEGMGNTGYDKNGNIQSMVRNGRAGNSIANYGYDYEANTNKVDKINNGGSVLVDYTYNTIGQMTSYLEAGNTMNIFYNAYGLVKEIRKGSTMVETFIYDDRGDRVKKIEYDNTGITIVKTTYYVHDVSGNVLATYEKTKTGTLALVEVPIYGGSRLGEYKPGKTTFYELNDHLGNVRAVIGASYPETFKATMESENAVTEDKQFKNIAPRTGSKSAANKTPGGDESIYVNNARPVGPAIILPVSPGDVITIDTYAYYEGGTGYSSPLENSVLTSAIISAFGGAPGVPGDPGNIFNTLNNAINAGSFAAAFASSPNDRIPAAYLNMIMFDGNRVANAVVLPMAAIPITIDANGHLQQITIPPITIPSPGYIYVYISNNSNSANPVYFDDLTITQLHSPFVAGGDYYPYGLAMEDRQIKIEPYRYGYQGQYAEKDSVTGWNNFELRMYDARFGRWLSPDPYGQFDSPYSAMGNNPASGTDPDGGWCCGGKILSSSAGKAVASESARKAGSSMSTTLLKEVTVAASQGFYPSLLGETVNIGGILRGNFGDGNHIWTSSGDFRLPTPAHKYPVAKQSELDKFKYLYSEGSTGPFHINGVIRTPSVSEIIQSTPNNPLINVFSSGNDIADLGTTISVGQTIGSKAARELNYWSKGARIGGELLGHTFGAIGLGLAYWSYYDEKMTNNIGAHTYLGIFVEVSTFSVGIFAGIAGAPVVATGAALVGFGYGVYAIMGGEAQIDRLWGQINSHKNRIHRIH